MKFHSMLHKDKTVRKIQPAIKIRPIRVAAQKKKVLMVIWRDALNGENVDWFDEEDVEVCQFKIACTQLYQE